MDDISLATAAQQIGVDARTLRYAAKVGNLVAKLITPPVGRPYYLTTLREARRWKATHTPHIKKL